MWIFRPTIQLLADEIDGARDFFVSSPWASEFQVSSLLDAISPNATVELWMRLTPDDTPFEEGRDVLEGLRARASIRLARHPSLHWKAYMTKSIGFIGSSNCTEYGLPSDGAGNLEALLKLTPAQLKDAWTFKLQIAKELIYFASVDEALEWWLGQAHSQVSKPSPDAPPMSLRPILPRPHGFMR
jgi:hypothetical protein